MSIELTSSVAACRGGRGLAGSPGPRMPVADGAGDTVPAPSAVPQPFKSAPSSSSHRQARAHVAGPHSHDKSHRPHKTSSTKPRNVQSRK